MTVLPPAAAGAVLGAGEYLLGALWLVVIVLALGFGAWRLRALALPAWTGAPARLAESVLGVFGVIALGELLGSFGLFTAPAMLVVSLVLAGLCALGGRRNRQRFEARGPADDPAPPDPGSGRPGLSGRAGAWISVAALAALAAGWAVPTLGALAAGMDRADSLWYHMPLSAEFVQSASTTGLHYFDPIFFAVFYPANSELLHAIPILGFERDFVSPFLNIGFLGIGLLACWCIGRPFGVAPQSLLAGSLVLGSQSLIEFQAGESLNDIVGVAVVLAAGALLVNGFMALRAGGAAPAPGREPEAVPGRERYPSRGLREGGSQADVRGHGQEPAADHG